MKKIKLTRGYEAIVDDSDFEDVSKYRWYYAHGYAVRTVYNNGKPYQLRMHRLLLNTPNGMDTDHVNRNRLDNRRKNLRVASRSENVANSFVTKQNKSGYKGVSWKKSNSKWCAQIRFNNKVFHIGLYSDIKKAAKAYNKVAKKFFGKFAYLNKTK